MALGPATQAPHDVLRPDVLLCVGEDAREFEAAMRAAGRDPEPLHSYRGTMFWAIGERLAVCTGIGTPSMEPVLWELLRPGIVRSVVLVGTAGTLPASTSPTMTAFQVDPALSGVSALGDEGPLRPSFDLDLPKAASVSTDLFYGFAPETPYPTDAKIQAAFRHHLGRDALVDMESHPFYWLMARMAPKAAYTAVKVAANPVTDLDALTDASAEALRIAVAAALPD